MFSLTTKYGNTLDLADCVLNSLEIESPFITSITGTCSTV